MVGFFDWLEGKWADGSSPVGPYLVTADEIPDPQSLPIRLELNGEVRQQSTTGAMIFSCAELIAFASRLCTLAPGDIILTGTPSGVGAATGTFLSDGDVLVAEVEGLGALTTPVRSGASATPR
jgi:2-keto-4-pentenoate hydratase/2-oxohepta-3-ene-1,7-dioic acid hydratase in catechol pathway